MMNNQMMGMGNMGMMNPNMMNNQMMGMGNMGMMNPNMMNNQMMGMDQNMMVMMAMMNNMGGMPGVGNMGGIGNIDPADAQGWNLIFENQHDKQSYIVRISEQKTIQEEIDKYREQSMNIDKCKFIYNSKELYPPMRICESGLSQNCKILVISLRNLKGA